MEVSGRTREAEAKKATPLRRVANCMFAVATNLFRREPSK